MYKTADTLPEEKIDYFKLCDFLYKEIRKRDEMLEKYAFITSHELRAPVARIKGLINIFKHTLHNKDVCHVLAERLGKCANELDEVVTILNDLTEEQSLELD